MIQQAKRDTRLSETSLVRIWELTLMWEINTRGQQSAPPIFDEADLSEESGDEGTGESELPEPNETITEEAD
jgi:hypothetical protein